MLGAKAQSARAASVAVGAASLGAIVAVLAGPRPSAPRVVAPHRGTSPAASTPPGRPPRAIREIRVRLACDEEFRRVADWRQDARRRLARASDVYEREFQIRWTPVDLVEWTSDDSAPDFDAVARELDQRVKPDGVDVVVGLTGQDRPSGAKKKYEFSGYGLFIGRRAIARAHDSLDYVDSDDSVLVHELGHVMGAWHCSDARAVMHCPSGDAWTIDPSMRRVVETTRSRDFSAGVEWLDDAAIDELMAAYLTSHAPDATFTVAGAMTSQAWDASYKDGKSARGLRLYERRLRVVERLNGPDSSEAGTAAIDAACAAEEDGEFDLAIGLAARGIRLIDATKGPQAVTDSDLRTLSYPLFISGRFDEARAVYGRLLALRKSAQPVDPKKTTEVETWMRWAERFTGRAAAAPATPGAPLRELSRRAYGRDADVLDESERRDGPAAGSMFVSCGRRPGASAPRSTDPFHETFVVSVARPGVVAAVFEDADGLRRRIAAPVTVEKTRRDVRVNVVFVPGPSSGTWNCRIDVDSFGEDVAGPAEEFECGAPWDATSRVKDRFVPEGGATMRLPESGGPLVAWRWIGGASTAPASADAAGAATSDPSRESAVWRLSVEFAPSDGK